MLSDKQKSQHNAAMPPPKRQRTDAFSFKSEQTLTETKKFLNELNEFTKMLNKIDHDFNCPLEFIYDECAELKRRVQLDAEETIAEIKQKNGFDINTDENKLDAQLTMQIEAVNDQRDLFVSRINKFEKETIVSYEKNKQDMNKQLPLTELNKSKLVLKHFVSHWQVCLAELNFEDKKMREAAAKLKEYQLKLNEFINSAQLLIFSNKFIELKQLEPKKEFQLSHYMCLKQTIHFQKANCFDFEAVKKISDLDLSAYDSRRTAMKKHLDDSHLLIFRKKCSQDNHIVVFNPVENKIVREFDLKSSLTWSESETERRLSGLLQIRENIELDSVK